MSGCTSGRSVRLNITLDVPTSPATRLSPAEALALLGAVCLGEVPTLDRPSRWVAAWRPAAVAALAANPDRYRPVVTEVVLLEDAAERLRALTSSPSAGKLLVRP